MVTVLKKNFIVRTETDAALHGILELRSIAQEMRKDVGGDAE